MSIINSGRVFLGVETLKCPVCGRPNRIKVHSDMPEREQKTCRRCSYTAIINYAPILDKYGLTQGLNMKERRDIGRHLKKNIALIN